MITFRSDDIATKKQDTLVQINRLRETRSRGGHFIWSVSISHTYKRVNRTNLYCRGICKIEHNLGRWK